MEKDKKPKTKAIRVVVVGLKAKGAQLRVTEFGGAHPMLNGDAVWVDANVAQRLVEAYAPHLKMDSAAEERDLKHGHWEPIKVSGKIAEPKEDVDLSNPANWSGTRSNKSMQDKTRARTTGSGTKPPPPKEKDEKVEEGSK